MTRLLRQPLGNRCLTAVVRPLARFLSQDVLMRVPVIGVVEVGSPQWPCPSVLMRNEGDDRIASLFFWRGADAWEPTTIRTFLGLVTPGATVLDVGANSGLFSLLAARLDPSVRVHAVEPAARVFSLLQSNVNLNGLVNVTCHRLACSDATGGATLHVPTGVLVPVTASLLREWPDAERTSEEPVECVTVDGLMRATGDGRVDVLKIDAEGSEDAVLRGAEATLEDHRPFVLAEVLGRSGLGEAVGTTLADHDYRFFEVADDGLRPCSDVPGGTDADESHNYLFCHAGRVDELHAALGL